MASRGKWVPEPIHTKTQRTNNLFRELLQFMILGILAIVIWVFSNNYIVSVKDSPLIVSMLVWVLMAIVGMISAIYIAINVFVGMLLLLILKE